MPEDEETPRTPGWFGDGILENGVDLGAARRAAIRAHNAARQAQEAARDTQKAHQREEEGRRPRSAAPKAAALSQAAAQPEGVARVREALG